MASPFVWFELRGQDPEGTQKFYENLLGWQIQQVPGPGDRQMTMIGAPEPWAGIAQSDQTGWIPYVQVDDVDAATARARKLGATVVAKKVAGPAGLYATIADPSGAQIALWQPHE